MSLTKVASVLALSLILAPLAVSKAAAHAVYQEQAYVFAFGEVNKPGAIEFTEGMTVRRVAVLFEGTTSNADISRLVISRKDRSEIAVDFAAVMKGRIKDVALLVEGMTSNASLSRTVISRKDQANGMRSRIPVDLEGVLQGKKEDVLILVDDVIIIPEFGVSKQQ